MTIPKALLIVLVILLGTVVLIPVLLRFSTLGNSDAVGYGSIGGAREPGTGLVISTDEGEVWQNAGVAEPAKPSFPSKIWGIFYHPQKPEIVFLGSKGNGLWKSMNGGKTWQKMEDKNKILLPNSDIYKVAVSPSNPKVMYLAVYQNKHGRVLKSEDEGASFREIYFVTATSLGVFDLQLNPGNSENVIIVTGQGGILETQNSGRTWRVKKWFGQSLLSLLANPFSFFEFYLVAGDDRLYKTFDGGENWEDFTENLKKGWNAVYQPQENTAGSGLKSLKQAFQPQGVNLKTALDTLVIDSKAPNILYVSLPNNLMRSYDGGVSWSGIDVPIPPDVSINSVAISSRSSAIIFVGAGTQLYKSVDNGVNWKIINVPISRKIKTVYPNPLKPSEILMELQ